MDKKNNELIKIFLEPVRKCSDYKPAFGQSKSEGMSLSDFTDLYGRDSFYTWIGLNDPLLYAAHKAAGGLTSVYRQVGIGSERLLQTVIMSSLGLKKNQITWEYLYDKPDGKKGVHILDAKIAIEDLCENSKNLFRPWLKSALKKVSLNNKSMQITGAAFEIRQGYKSADSKRQNADLRFGIRAYQASLIPVFAVLSSQVSDPVVKRYQRDGMLVLTGINSSDTTTSTFAFFRDVIGFDLAAFFELNSKIIRQEIKLILEKLLTAK
jgi:hypothetical protein